MTMIIATLAWAFAEFVILHDNAKTRRDVKAFREQFDGNMKSFWARMFENESSAKIEIQRVDGLVKDLVALARLTASQDAKLENKAFFELNELREAQAQLVDNMSDRHAHFETTINMQAKRIVSLDGVVKDLVISEFQRNAKKKKSSLKTVFKKIGNRKLVKGSRARA